MAISTTTTRDGSSPGLATVVHVFNTVETADGDERDPFLRRRHHVLGFDNSGEQPVPTDEDRPPQLHWRAHGASLTVALPNLHWDSVVGDFIVSPLRTGKDADHASGKDRDGDDASAGDDDLFSPSTESLSASTSPSMGDDDQTDSTAKKTLKRQRSRPRSGAISIRSTSAVELVRAGICSPDLSSAPEIHQLHAPSPVLSAADDKHGADESLAATGSSSASTTTANTTRDAVATGCSSYFTLRKLDMKNGRLSMYRQQSAPVLNMTTALTSLSVMELMSAPRSAPPDMASRADRMAHQHRIADPEKPHRLALRKACSLETVHEEAL